MEAGHHADVAVVDVPGSFDCSLCRDCDMTQCHHADINLFVVAAVVVVDAATKSPSSGCHVAVYCGARWQTRRH